jgi:hypothetical protein
MTHHLPQPIPAAQHHGASDRTSHASPTERRPAPPGGEDEVPTLPNSIRRLLLQIQPHAPLAEFGSSCWLISGTGEHGLVVPLLDRYAWAGLHATDGIQAATRAGLLTIGTNSSAPRYERAPDAWRWSPDRVAHPIGLAPTKSLLTPSRVTRINTPTGDR